MPKTLTQNLLTEIDQVIRPEEIEELLKSSSRTITLLELLAELGSELTVGEISDRMNIPQSSTSSLIKSLTESGYLVRNRNNRKISASPRLGFLGLMASNHSPVTSKIIKKAEDISIAVSETVIVAMRNSIYSQYIYIHRAPNQKSHEHVALGSLRPLVCSATGWAMLLQKSENEISKLIRTTSATIEDPHWLQSTQTAATAIQTAKTNRYAFSQGPSKSGTAGIAIPLQALEHSGTFSLGVAGNEIDLIAKKEDIIAYLQDVHL